MSQAITKTTLPSAGRLEGVPAEVSFRTITTEEEKMLFDSSDDYVDFVLKKCIVEPSNVEEWWPLMTTADKVHILIQERIASYGPYYFYSVQCPTCNKWTEYKIDLRDLKVDYLPEDFAEPYDTFNLKSDEETEVSLKLPRVKDAEDNDEKLKRFKLDFPEAKGNQLYIYNLMSNIHSVNGQVLKRTELERFVKSLAGMDSSYLKHRISKMKVGVNLDRREICSNKECQSEIDFRIRFGLDFFRTRFDD